jgi:hypothetical protein
MFGSQMAREQMYLELDIAKSHSGPSMTEEQMNLLKHTMHMCSSWDDRHSAPKASGYRLHQEVWASISGYTIKQHRQVFANPNLAVPKEAKICHKAAQLYRDDPTDDTLVTKAYVAERSRRTCQEDDIAAIVAAPPPEPARAPPRVRLSTDAVAARLHLEDDDFHSDLLRLPANLPPADEWLQPYFRTPKPPALSADETRAIETERAGNRALRTVINGSRVFRHVFGRLDGSIPDNEDTLNDITTAWALRHGPGPDQLEMVLQRSGSAPRRMLQDNRYTGLLPP